MCTCASVASNEMDAADAVKLRDGYQMPRLGLGTYMVGKESVCNALKSGYRLIDTASLYGNEEGVGAAILESGIPREELFVVTKAWNNEHGREEINEAFQRSLKKLGLDYVDLYLMHSPAGGRLLETWDTMCQLQAKGLIRSVGVANFNASHLTELKKARPDNIPMVNQIEIHPFVSWDECLEVCQREGITVMAYSPLAQAGKLTDPTLVGIAKKYDRSPAQVMIRWSLQRGFVCIPRSSKDSRIKENASVFDFTLSQEDMATLNGMDVGYIADWPGIMQSPWDP